MLYYLCLLKKEGANVVNLENLRKGSAEILILHLLIQGDSYGYKLIKDIAAMCSEQYAPPGGTLYPVLYRLVERGYVTDYDTYQGKRKRLNYRITEEGKLYFQELWGEYRLWTEEMYSIVEGQGDDAG